MTQTHWHMSRGKAFLIHLISSILIFSILLSIVVFFWYPWPLFDLEGGWEGIRLVAFVDIILGPLLTLVLFKPGKPGLKFDIGLVVSLQIAALSWGIFTLYDTRPVLLVMADDHFRPVSNSLLETLPEHQAVRDKWQQMRPRRVMVELPKHPGEAMEAIKASNKKFGVIHLDTERYRPLEEHWSTAIENSIDIRYYVKDTPDWQKQLDALLSEHQKTEQQLAFLPIFGRYKRTIVVADRESMDFVDVLNLPYEPMRSRPVLTYNQRWRKTLKAEGQEKAPQEQTEGSTQARANNSGDH